MHPATRHDGDDVDDFADRKGLRAGGRVPGPAVYLEGEQSLGRASDDVGRINEGPVPLPVGTVITSSMTGRWVSAKFCLTQVGRRTEWVTLPRAAKSASTAMMSTGGGASAAPQVLRV